MNPLLADALSLAVIIGGGAFIAYQCGRALEEKRYAWAGAYAWLGLAVLEALP